MCQQTVLSSTGLIFAEAGRGHGQDPEVVLSHPTSLAGWGKELFSREKGILQLRKCAAGSHPASLGILSM